MNVSALAVEAQNALAAVHPGRWALFDPVDQSPLVKVKVNARAVFSRPVIDGAVLPWDGLPLSPTATRFVDHGLGVQVVIVAEVPRFDDFGDRLPSEVLSFTGASFGQDSLVEALEQATADALAMAEHVTSVRAATADLDRRDASGVWVAPPAPEAVSASLTRFPVPEAATTEQRP